MDNRLLRITALYERDDCKQVDGAWYVPIAGLSEVLAAYGLTIVNADEGLVSGSHGAQGEPVTALGDVAHETAPGNAMSSMRCGCATLDDCLRRGCGTEKRCDCATLDDCLRRGC